jgi:hypothetical protein
VADLLVWLEGTALATWTRESPSLWAYPTILTLHTVGLGIVVGLGAAIDLRLLGVARRVPLPSLTPAFTLIAWGLVLNAGTGLLLLIADATTKTRQPILYIKLGLIGLAVRETLRARRLMRSDDARLGTEASPRARTIAVSSLVLWAGAITAGRLMAYL